jgi:hypothetical protein
MKAYGDLQPGGALPTWTFLAFVCFSATTGPSLPAEFDSLTRITNMWVRNQGAMAAGEC